MATQNVCFFNKFGFCKYLEKCRKFHEKAVCDKSNCEIRECNLRHPRKCRYLREFGFCKFMDWCKFSHEIVRNTKNDDTKKLEEKLHAFENQLKKKDDKISKLESEIDDLHLKFSEQKQLMSKMNKKLNVLKEKDILVQSLQEKLTNLEKKIDIIEKNVDQNVQEVVINDKACNQPETLNDINCEKCDFIAKNEHGLKVHIKAKHTGKNKFKCYTCDFSCETKVELTEHNDIYWNSHRMTFYPHKKRYYLEEIEQMKKDGFKVQEDFINSVMKLDD